MTLLAFISIFPTVDFPVGSEVLPLAKGFPTFIAVIKPCYTANSLMGKETESVAKKFSTLAAFIRPFLSVNFLVLNKVKFLGAGFPMFAELTKPFTSEDSLIPNKYVYVAGDYLAFFPALMTFSTVKNSFTLLSVVLFLPATKLFAISILGERCSLPCIMQLFKNVGLPIPNWKDFCSMCCIWCC